MPSSEAYFCACDLMQNVSSLQVSPDKKYKTGTLRQFRLRRQIGREFHGTASFARLMPVKALHAAVTGVL